MNDKKAEEIYEILRKENGEKYQIIKAIEELNELSTELARYVNNTGDLDDIFGELADAKIVIYQLSRIFGPKKIREIQEIKLKRLEYLLGVDNNEDPPKV